MAADDRQIITSTKIFPKEGNTLEEGNVKYMIDSAVQNSLGAKTTFTDLDANQDDIETWYATDVSISGFNQLRDTGNEATLKFCYIKNLSPTLDLTVSLAGDTDGEWDDNEHHWNLITRSWNPGFYIIVPAEGSVFFRGNDTLRCDVIHVYFAGTSSIEYLIAK